MKIANIGQILSKTQLYKISAALKNLKSASSLIFKILILNRSSIFCSPDTREPEENQGDGQSGVSQDGCKIPQSEIFPAATLEDLKYYKKAMDQFCSPMSKIHGFVDRQIIDTALLILAKSFYREPPRIQKHTDFYIGKKLNVVIEDNLKPVQTFEGKDGSAVHLWEYLETNTKPLWPLSLFQEPHRLHIVFAVSTNKDNIVTQEILTVEYGIFETLHLEVSTKALFRFWS